MGEGSHRIITDHRVQPRAVGDDIARPAVDARTRLRTDNAAPQAGPSSETEPGAETAIAHLRGLVQRRKAIIALTFVICMGLCLTLAALLPKTYSAKALLLIDPQPVSATDPNAGRDAQRFEEANIETEMSTLLSRQHMRAVLASLEETAPDEAETLGRVGWIRSFARQLRTTLGPRLAPIVGPGWSMGDEESDGQGDTDTASAEARERKLDDLERNTNVLQELRSRVIAVRYTAASPTAASTIANQIVEVYVNTQSQLRQEQLKRELNWADRVTVRAKAELDQANQEMAEFISGNVMPDEARTRAVEQQLFVLRNQLAAASADLKAAVQRSADLRLLRTRATDWDFLAANGEFPRIADLAQAAKDLARQREEEAATARAGSRASLVQARLDQVGAELAKAINEVQRQQQLRVETVASRREAAQKALTSVEDTRGEITSVLTRLVQIKKKVADAEAVYQGRVQARMRFQERLSVFVPNLRMLSAATPPLRPSTPHLLSFFLPASVASLILGCLVALAIDLGDTRIRNQAGLESFLGVPCCAVLPTPAKRWPRLIGRRVARKRDAYSTAVNSLALACMRRRNVLLRPLRTIAVVSVSDLEGRSRLATELVQAVTALNQRALLLRIERFSKARAKNRDVGCLGDILGGDCDPEAAIQTVPGSGIDLLRCGAADLNSLDLFADQRISAALDKLAKSYELIVIDAAPLRDSMSSVWIAAEADLILFVARAGLSDGREMAERMAQLKACASYAWVPPEVMGVLTHATARVT